MGGIRGSQSGRTETEGQEGQESNSREHLTENEHTGRAQSRGEVEASLEKQFGIWLLNAQKAGKRSLALILKAVGEALTVETGE